MTNDMTSDRTNDMTIDMTMYKCLLNIYIDIVNKRSNENVHMFQK